MPERICLVHIIYDLGLGGAERQLYELCLRLDPARFELHVVCFHGGGAYIPLLEAAGVQVHIVEKRLLLDSGFLARLAGALRELSPMIVHTWMLSANLWGRLALDCAGLRPLVLAAERKTFVNENILRRALVGWLGSRADMVLGNSRDVAANQIADGVPAWKTVVIENGIEFARFDAAPPREKVLREEGLDPALPLVLNVGRFHPQKDQKSFVAAAARLLDGGSAAQFAIVGDGELRDALQSQIDASGYGARIHLLKSRPEIEGILMACDIFCLPSLTEGFPNVLAEAMACGKAVVATRVSGSVDMIRDRQNGRLIRVGDSVSLADCIADYLGDAALRTAHGAAAKDYIRGNNSVEAMVRRYSELYEAMLASREA